MRIDTTTHYDKQSRKITPKLRAKVLERLELFIATPYHPLLNNHKLHGERHHQRSINITGSYRLIFEQVDTETVRLIDIDTHPNLYRE